MLTKTDRQFSPVALNLPNYTPDHGDEKQDKSHIPRWLCCGSTSISTIERSEADLIAGTIAVLRVHFDRISAEQLERAFVVDFLDIRTPSQVVIPRISLEAESLPTTSLFETRLRSAFENDPLEDGIRHPAERLVREEFHGGNASVSMSIAKSLALNFEDPGMATSMLQCLGRIRGLGNEQWRASIIRNALAALDVAIRDAAVEAAEAWGDEHIAEMLSDHLQYESVPVAKRQHRRIRGSASEVANVFGSQSVPG